MKTLKKYLAIFLISYKNHTVYIYDILGTNGIFVMRITIIIFLFKLIYSTKGGVVSGYTIEEVSWALIFAQVLVKAKPAINVEISDEVKSGKIATYLLTPVSYIWYKFFENFSKFFHNIIVGLISGLLVGFIFFGHITTTIPGILAGIVLIFGAMFISFFGYMMIGLLSFFVEDNEGFRYVYSKLDMLFGGNILPLPFLPVIVQNIAFLTPFAYAGYTVGLVFSKFNMHNFLNYFAMQILWSAIFIFTCSYLYSKGRTKLVANGG